MTMKWMAVLALAFAAPAAFGQTAKSVPADGAAAGQVKILRSEVRRDKLDLSAKVKAVRSARAQLAAQWQAERAKLKGAPGTRAQKAAARKALREKYARLMKELREHNAAARKSLREDMTSKSGLIKRLRQS
ncbi:MAG: hypothetical protein KGL74_06285 [Elusimicrobia bacterium]|nr:hypothetical protein [Elusimicrobiota bacterium]